jgi:hypothetical protein
MGGQRNWQRLNDSRISRRTLLGASAKAGVGAAGLALVGCGDDDDDDAVAAAVTPSREDRDDSQPSAPAPGPATAPQPTPAASASFDGEGLVAGAGAFDWRIARVDQGTKPGIALEPDGTPLIAYLLERMGNDGWVRTASPNGDGFDVDTLQEGYNYGPLDVRVSPQGVAAVAYHFHDWEDGVVAVRDNAGRWDLVRISDPGHDGWDSSLAIAPDGRLVFAGVDPVQFGATTGIEFTTIGAGGDFQVEPIGSGPQPYEWGVSVAVDANGSGHITYFDAGGQDLIYGVNSGGGWDLQPIFTDGDAGRFSVLTLDDGGAPHVAFFQSEDRVNENGEAPGDIIHGTLADGVWIFETIGRVEHQVLGFEGARRTAAISMAGGQPIVAFIDESKLAIAARTAGGDWDVETIVEAGSDPFQVVGLDVDASGTPHLTFSTVTRNGPLDGEVWYVAGVRKA